MAIAASAASATGLASDTRSTDALRTAAARDPQAAIKETARQFEALFMQQLMKSMRDATLASGMVDNEGSKLGTELLDTQLSTQMTGLPGGLAEAIARQLQRQMGLGADEQAALSLPDGQRAGLPYAGPSANASARASGGGAVNLSPAAATQAQDFVAEHEQAAKAAEAETGIPAAFMLAQAAHESGWGRRDIRMADGAPSNNLFGIKAGPGWKGAVAEITTTEYIDGQAQKVTARFRAYPNTEASFADYARLMKTSPRYAQVIDNAGTAQGFAQGLQRAGYATDPAYADKLTRVINTTLRLQRAVSA